MSSSKLSRNTVRILIELSFSPLRGESLHSTVTEAINISLLLWINPLTDMFSEIAFSNSAVCNVTTLTARKCVIENSKQQRDILAWISIQSRSQWLCGLRRTSAAAWVVGSWVRTSLRALMFVCCLCCLGSGFHDELITRLEELYRSRARVCVGTSTARRLKPEMGCFVAKKINSFKQACLPR